MTDFKNCTKTIKDCPNCPKLFECDEYEQLETTAKVENEYAILIKVN